MPKNAYLVRNSCLIGCVLLSVYRCAADQEQTKASLIISSCGGPTSSVIVATISATGSVISNSFPNTKIDNAFLNPSGQIAIVKATNGRRVLSRAKHQGRPIVSTPVKVNRLPENARGDLSPDGKRVCFLVEELEKDWLRLINVDSGDIENVFVIAGQLSPPSWSPDGACIAYYFAEMSQTSRDAFRVGVSRRKEDGWEPLIVTPPSKPARRNGNRFHAPVWSSDSGSILFEGRYEDAEEGPQTYIVRLEDQSLTRLGGYPLGASPAPGGVVYSKVNDGIYLFETATGRSRRIFKVSLSLFPQLSLNMHWLAYSDPRGTIYAVDLRSLSKHKVFDAKVESAKWSFRWLEHH